MYKSVIFAQSAKIWLNSVKSVTNQRKCQNDVKNATSATMKVTPSKIQQNNTNTDSGPSL